MVFQSRPRSRARAECVSSPTAIESTPVAATSAARSRVRPPLASIFGSADTARDFVDYAQRYLDGRLPIDRLVTERYRLDEINEACDAMLTGGVGRGVIVFD